MERLDEFRSLAIDFARERFKEVGELMPTAFVFYTNLKGETTLVLAKPPADFNDETKKGWYDGLRLMVRSLLADGVSKDTIAVLFMLESWIASVPVDSDLANLPSPSEMPEREEVVVITAETATRESMHLMPIRRYDDCVRLGDVETKLDVMKGDANASVYGAASRIIP